MSYTHAAGVDLGVFNNTRPDRLAKGVVIAYDRTAGLVYGPGRLVLYDATTP